MPVHRLKEFGRKIITWYEKYPLTINSIVGGTVYTAGEISAQLQVSDLKDIDIRRVFGIGTLGIAEGGFVMVGW
jgi:hypothetical protein